MCLILLSWILVAGIGCGVESRLLSVGPKTYRPRPKDWPIDVYHGAKVDRKIVESIKISKDEADVPRGSETVGRLSCEGTNWGSILESARKQARGLGGDGVVVSLAFHSSSSILTGGDKIMKISVVRYDAQGGLAPRAATASKAPVVYEEPYADRHKVAILGTNFGKTLASGSPCPMVLFVQSIDGAPVTQTMRGWVKLLPGRHKVELGCRSTDTRVSCSLRRPFSKDIVVAAGRTYYFRGTVNGTFSKTRGGKALSSEEISKLDAFNENPVVRDAALWKLASQNVALEMKDGRFFAPKNLASVTLVVETTR